MFHHIMSDGTKVNSDGNLEMPLPYRNVAQDMPDNSKPVYNRMKTTLEKLSRDGKRLKECLDIMDKYLAKLKWYHLTS